MSSTTPGSSPDTYPSPRNAQSSRPPSSTSAVPYILPFLIGLLLLLLLFLTLVTLRHRSRLHAFRLANTRDLAADVEALHDHPSVLSPSIPLPETPSRGWRFVRLLRVPSLGRRRTEAGEEQEWDLGVGATGVPPPPYEVGGGIGKGGVGRTRVGGVEGPGGEPAGSTGVMEGRPPGYEEVMGEGRGTTEGGERAEEDVSEQRSRGEGVDTNEDVEDELWTEGARRARRASDNGSSGSRDEIPVRRWDRNSFS